MPHPPPRRRPAFRLLIGLLAAFSLVIPQTGAHAAPYREPGDKKIADAVRTDLKDGKATFLVRLKGEADLGSARKAATKAAKGRSVYAAKTAYAKKSQARLRALLIDRKADHTPFWIVNTVRVTADAVLAAEIAALPEVTAIKPIERLEIPETRPGKTQPKAKAAAAGAIEWNIDRIKAPRVWNESNNRGEGIVIGVLDSGVEFEHPEIAAQYRGRRPDGRVTHDYNWFNPSGVCGREDSVPCDRTGHGTHVTGTLVGKNGIGVAPGATWIAAGACCETHDLLAGAEWMLAPTDMNGENPRPDLAPHIVNNSTGSNTPDYDDMYEEILDAWLAAGIFPMVANGNLHEGHCARTPVPGQYTETYSAGDFDINDRISDMSSRGPGENGEIKPNIAAPGSDIRSSDRNGGYRSRSGTSMASPHVAGTVALIWSAAPSLLGDIAATRALLDGTAIDTPDMSCGGTPEDNNVYGEGRLDAHAAVQAAPDEPLGTLTGTITAAGRPVADAEVKVTGPLGRTAGTGHDGTYSMPRLSPGRYQVTVAKYGHQTATATVTILDGQTATADVTLPQQPQGTVSGTVTVRGTAQAGVTLVVPGTPVKVTTDAAGLYRFTLLHGSHRLEVKPPSACAESATEQITVAGDVTRNIDLQVRADEFGHTCEVGTEPYVAGNRRLTLTGMDMAERVALPFPVPFYGTARTELWVSTEGYASFAEPPAPAEDNDSLPEPWAPNQAVYPFWDDLRIGDDAGVYTATVGTAPHRSFVIEWRDVTISSAATSKLSFSALLGEDGTISYRYKDIDTPLEEGESATVGIENADGTDALQYSYKTSLLRDGQSVTFTAAGHGVVRGTVTDANDDEPVANATVEFPDIATYTTGADGTFTGQIRAGNHNAKVNAPNYGTTHKDITITHGTITTMNTGLITGKIAATPAELNLTAPPGGTTTATITLTNQGWPTPFEATSDSAWLTVTPAQGGLTQNQTATLTITATAAATERNGKITITSTSGRKPVIEIPVTITQ
ncbi:S8 family serine peptidase [Spongiactinospora sp. TRM90649]|uniref:S8 family serine peptidase n=1 Tax=Spongiactinospora sp. TRM90649 TaxID=3031114 RepID=UPI0023F99663|nr:S8 family serine peptidase [Spongiactinospora sp. TRM90649]MDF5753857.1 S8 family serine peptidase [Spongiactinospora sp. TRM90649]